MTWLSKVGQILAKVLGFVTGLTPLIGRTIGGEAGEYVGKVGTTLDQALSVIQVAEAMFEAAGKVKAGPDKLKAATPFIAKLLLSTETLAHAKIANQDAFNTAVTNIASNLADLLNSLDPNSVNTHQAGTGAHN